MAIMIIGVFVAFCLGYIVACVLKNRQIDALCEACTKCFKNTHG